MTWHLVVVVAVAVVLAAVSALVACVAVIASSVHRMQDDDGRSDAAP